MIVSLRTGRREGLQSTTLSWQLVVSTGLHAFSEGVSGSSLCRRATYSVYVYKVTYSVYVYKVAMWLYF